ncbi:hypothetical protein [Thermus caldilimi]|uniref:hypothetical protein n=1 Tax=Thermus caldilimi TaxID=2483360 RepID=UPI001075D7E2|nr:hypothetical protein [Thermus caldilimi]
MIRLREFWREEAEVVAVSATYLAGERVEVKRVRSLAEAVQEVRKARDRGAVDVEIAWLLRKEEGEEFSWYLEQRLHLHFESTASEHLAKEVKRNVR